MKGEISKREMKMEMVEISKRERGEEREAKIVEYNPSCILQQQ